jgi:hypothetical protein
VSGGGVDVGIGGAEGGGGASGGGDGSGGGNHVDVGDGTEGSGTGSGGVGFFPPEIPCPDRDMCSVLSPYPPADEAPEVEAATPVVTIRDVAHLVPAQGNAGMEPSGWTVIGLPTNFFADVSPNVVSTTLLGTTADVRFTPVSFVWDHGDGSTLTSSIGGATWADLRVPEFSTTATSHVYKAPGDYTVTLTVLYSAEYRIGGGDWRALAGTVPSTAPPITATAKQAKTVLVPGECALRTVSPGC